MKKFLRIKDPFFWIVVVLGLGLLLTFAYLLVDLINDDTDEDRQIKNNNQNQVDDLKDTPSDETGDNRQIQINNQNKVDDWQYSPLSDTADGFSSTIQATAATTSVDSTVGFSTGGAKDINNFRQNVANGYLPSPADISHEGLFYDYFFETGLKQNCDELFCPSYATAVSADPFSEETEHFLAVGLNSNIKADDFQRKKLNLVVVLDISGSMSSPFDSYYYDQFRNSPEGFTFEIDDSTSKMEIANQSLAALLDHLKPEDRLGVILFDHTAYLAKDLRLVAETDMPAIKNHILEITPQGGTNMEAGYQAGAELLNDYRELSADDYENRIIFLTDAMPNLGDTNEFDLANLIAVQAQNNIYTSFIGIGLDFNSELTRAITKNRGANYFSVQSSQEFKQQLDEGFEYMVTPLVFDLKLELKAEGYDIKAVYGSPEADLATGEIMQINTLFPSPQTDSQTRGGLVLLHLDKLTEQANLKLKVTYQDRNGQEYQNQQKVQFPQSNTLQFSNTGIHKGVVLARQVNVLKDWLKHQSTPSKPVVDYHSLGIPIIDQPIDLGYWEKTSRPLTLSPAYKLIIQDLRDYMAQQMPDLNDQSLERELELLDLILTESNSQ